MEDVRYPTGRMNYAGPNTPDQRKTLIQTIEQAPAVLRKAVDGLSVDQIDSRYRDQGWTLRQVVHHVADSHVNGYLRLKWTMAEDSPTVKTYDQNDWAQLADSRMVEVSTSLDMLAGIHQRWGGYLRLLKPADFEKFFVHPETGKEWTVDFSLSLYAWHGKHQCRPNNRVEG